MHSPPFLVFRRWDQCKTPEIVSFFPSSLNPTRLLTSPFAWRTSYQISTLVDYAPSPAPAPVVVPLIWTFFFPFPQIFLTNPFLFREQVPRSSQPPRFFSPPPADPNTRYPFLLYFHLPKDFHLIPSPSNLEIPPHFGWILFCPLRPFSFVAHTLRTVFFYKNIPWPRTLLLLFTVGIYDLFTPFPHRKGFKGPRSSHPFSVWEFWNTFPFDLLRKNRSFNSLSKRLVGLGSLGFFQLGPPSWRAARFSLIVVRPLILYCPGVTIFEFPPFFQGCPSAASPHFIFKTVKTLWLRSLLLVQFVM